tara:strand:+ start:205 stop:1659 length:1455 start_codon:yes stop_codon:yes gene_type:complete
MPRKLELTWFQPRKCWRKRVTIDGKKKDFYFKYGKSKSDLEGYKRALADWKQKEAAIEAAKAALGPSIPEVILEKAIKYRQRLSEYHRLEGDEEKAQLFQNEVKILQKKIGKKNLTQNEVAKEISQLSKPKDNERWSWFIDSQMVAKYQKWTVGETPNDKSAGYNAENFLLLKKSEVPENLSPGRWAALSYSVYFFVDWLGKDKPLDLVTGKTLNDFRIHLLNCTEKKKSEGGFGRKTAYERMKDIRQFIRWCWQIEAIENLPRNLDSSDLSISFEDAEIVTFSKDEVKTLIDGAKDQMQLHLLLCLNCAMLPKDISDLKQSQVDWKNGRLERARSKTSKKRRVNEKSNRKVPVVDYKLWRQTFDLLKKFRSNDSERVLLNSNGLPLKRSEIGEDGKIDVTSNIGKNYERLRNRLEIPKEDQKPLKTFRSTGASKLEEHKEYGRYAQYYLGQSPRSIAEKHYVIPSKNQFDRAVKWLGQQYGLK